MGRRIGEEFEWEVGRRFDSNQNRCRYCIFWSVLLVSADSLRNHNNAKYRCCTCTLILSLHGESISEHYLHHFGQSRDTACRRSTCNSSTTFSRDDIQRKRLCDPTMTRYDKWYDWFLPGNEWLSDMSNQWPTEDRSTGITTIFVSFPYDP